jgi:hypothetical protein
MRRLYIRRLHVGHHRTRLECITNSSRMLHNTHIIPVLVHNHAVDTGLSACPGGVCEGLAPELGLAYDGLALSEGRGSTALSVLKGTTTEEVWSRE